MNRLFTSLYYTDGAFGLPQGRGLEIARDLGFETYHGYCYHGYWKGERLASGAIDEAAWRDRAARCLKRAAALFPHIYVGLAMDQDRYTSMAAIKANLAPFTPYQDQVVVVDLADEPGTKGEIVWTKRVTKDFLKKVRDAMDDLGWDQKPVGMVYTVTQSLSEEGFTIPPPRSGGVGPDWVGLEFYTRPNQGRELNRRIVSNQASMARGRLDPAQHVLGVAQGYDRNFAWDPDSPGFGEEALANLVWDSYKILRDNHRTLGITVFNLLRANSKGRPRGGAYWYPKVREQLARMNEDLKARNRLLLSGDLG